MSAANPIRRPVLRYHGGKFGNRGAVADKIAALFPPHRIYVEPFGGGGSVLMRKPPSGVEVYNDRWDVVVNVFRVLRDPDTDDERGVIAAAGQRIYGVRPGVDAADPRRFDVV